MNAWSRLIVPTIMTGVMMVVLIGLGVWQLHRLAWKTDLLDRIDAAESAPAVPLIGQSPAPFSKIAVTGVFRGQDAARYGSSLQVGPSGSQLGSDELVPLEQTDGLPILVDRGWVPDNANPPVPGGPVTIIGYARPAEPAGWLSADDNPAARRFYSLDPAAIGAALHTPLAPFTLVALGPVPAQPPIPATALPRPVNNHFAYALTWFGFAAILAVIFFLWARRSVQK